MMTSYFQALGKAIKSLTITVLRNAALFIPRVIILNYIWKLNGVIAAQGKYVAATTRRRRRILPCSILFYAHPRAEEKAAMRRRGSATGRGG